ncbi:MAG: sulfite oxidase-like oxidoreductase [Acidobacteria bacterium]|nr:sulfite oxidase-like oxidoreductase [Acidobacteriota bacterium]
MPEAEKIQSEAVAVPESQEPGVIISPDTRRGERIPPGQSRTRKWPVLDAAGAPPMDMSQWKLQLDGLIERPISLSWEEFSQLPRVRVFSDFHCVTRWSRLGNLWEGVSTKTLVELAGAVAPAAEYVLIHGYDYGWTTNLPLEAFLAEDALIATHHDGEPLSAEHGGPARLIVPSLYAWKSAKWIRAIEFLEHNYAGFWERNGYHMNGDPWREERFGY